MKHAYLILAHAQFEVLKYLVASLDDVRNHIFIHFDKKVSKIPLIKVKHANLTILTNRINVCWGDVSVVEAEYVLFTEAYKIGGFSYYHLLSGVDMPLKSQDYIHNFFSENNGKEFIGYYQGDIEGEILRKVGKIHLFTKNFRDSGKIVSLSKRIIRSLFLKFQYLFNISRNNSISFKKGTQWVSITPKMIELAIKNQHKILHIYRNTFCSDEIFLQTLCWNSSLRSNIYNIEDEAEGCMRMISWKNGEMLEWTSEDYNLLINSKLLFARKFCGEDDTLVRNIFLYLTQKDG